MRNADGTLGANATWTFDDIPGGGGGYIMGFRMHQPVDHTQSTGRMWAGTDVQNSYVRDPGDEKWTTLFRDDTMPASDFDSNGLMILRDPFKSHGFASYTGAISPSNHNRLYANFQAGWYTINVDRAKRLYEDGAISMTRWNLADKALLNNQGYAKFWTPGISIHPTNPDIAIVGTNNDGVYYTTNAGATVVQITGIPPPYVPAGHIDQPGGIWNQIISGEVDWLRYLVWIDQGNPNYVYVSSPGNGIYRSKTGVTGTFTHMAGSPDSASCITGLPDGTIFIVRDFRFSFSQPGGVGTPLVRDNNDGLWKCSRGGSFTHLPSSMSGYRDWWHVAVDPGNPDRIVLTSEKSLSYSLNGGADWNSTYPPAGTLKAGGDNIKWRVGYQEAFGAGISIDPLNRDRLWCSGGFGVARTAAGESVWSEFARLEDFSKGIEEHITNKCVTHPVTDRVIMIGWDLPFNRIESLTEYINMPNYGPVDAPGNRQGIQRGDSADYCLEDPIYWVGASGYNHSYTPNDGETWHVFPKFNQSGFPIGANAYSGQIRCNLRSQVVIATGAGVFECMDAPLGNWTAVELAGHLPLSDSNPTGYMTNGAGLSDRNNLAVDKERPGVFAVVISPQNWVDDQHPAAGLHVRNPNTGVWEHKRLGLIGEWAATPYQTKAMVETYPNTGGRDLRQFWQCNLTYVPGRPGEMLYCNHFDYQNDYLVHFTDDGEAASVVAPGRLKNVFAWTFGANIDPDSPYPAVIFEGQLDGNPYRQHLVTYDWFQTFHVILDKHPNNLVGFTTPPSGGSFQTVGRYFTGLSGRGAMYGTLKDVTTAT